MSWAKKKFRSKVDSWAFLQLDVKYNMFKPGIWSLTLNVEFKE